MNQEIYNTMYNELNEIKRKISLRIITHEEYIEAKRSFIIKYIDHKEEFIEVIKRLNMCIADGIVLGACFNVSCGRCHEAVYTNLLRKINKITNAQGFIF